MRFVTESRIAEVRKPVHLCCKIDPIMINKREIARILYTKGGESTSSIGAMLEVADRDINTWLNEGQWHLAKRSRMVDRDTQIDRLYDTLKTITDAIESGNGTAKDADNMQKITAAIRNLEHDKSVSAIIGSAEEFISWLYKKDVPAAQDFTRRFDQFIKQKAA